MLEKSIEAIVFDLGGVIINIDYGATIRAFQALGIKDFDTLFSQSLQAKLFNDLETGKISPQKFINDLLEQLPPQTSPNDVVSAWNAMILDIPTDRIEFLQELKRKYKIYLLSNTNQIHIDKVYRTWKKASPIKPEELFDKIYLSHELGMRKPNRDIFEHVCNDQSLNPELTLFIDDSIQHIQGAEQIGLRAIHLTGGQTIQSVLS